MSRKLRHFKCGFYSVRVADDMSYSTENLMSYVFKLCHLQQKNTLVSIEYLQKCYVVMTQPGVKQLMLLKMEPSRITNVEIIML